MFTFTLVDERFWSSMFMQHAKFIHNILDENEKELRKEAKSVKSRWKLFINGWVEDTFPILMKVTGALKIKVRARILDGITSGERVSFLLPKPDFLKLLEHMLMELTYVMEFYKGILTEVDVVEFWTSEAAQHTFLTSTVIEDAATRKQLTRDIRALNYSDKENRCETYEVYNNVLENGLELLNDVEQGNVSTRIDFEAMLQHEVEESLYGRSQLEKVKPKCPPNQDSTSMVGLCRLPSSLRTRKDH